MLLAPPLLCLEILTLKAILLQFCSSCVLLNWIFPFPLWGLQAARLLIEVANLSFNEITLTFNLIKMVLGQLNNWGFLLPKQLS